MSRPFSRQSLGVLTAGAALKAAPWAGATCEPAWAGPGATRGVATALERLPEHASRARRGGKSPRAQPTARPAAASRAQSPALCQVLPWTRRRKHLRGPFGPEVDQGAAPQRRKANRTHNSTCAVGTTQPSRQPKQRRRSASSARPQVRRAADICSRGEGGIERHGLRRGCQRDLMRVGCAPSRALPRRAPADDRQRLGSIRPHIGRGRTKIVLLLSAHEQQASVLEARVGWSGIRGRGSQR